jgi:hypothetical protein
VDDYPHREIADALRIDGKIDGEFQRQLLEHRRVAQIKGQRPGRRLDGGNEQRAGDDVQRELEPQPGGLRLSEDQKRVAVQEIAPGRDSSARGDR